MQRGIKGGGGGEDFKATFVFGGDLLEGNCCCGCCCGCCCTFSIIGGGNVKPLIAGLCGRLRLADDNLASRDAFAIVDSVCGGGAGGECCCGCGLPPFSNNLAVSCCACCCCCWCCRTACSVSMLLGFFGMSGGTFVADIISEPLRLKYALRVEEPAKLLRRFGEGAFGSKSALVLNEAFIS